MKKYFKFLGIAFLATTLCMSMASCSDKEDSNDDNNTQQGGGTPGGQGGNNSMSISFDGQTWSPETSGYNYAYYIENDGNPFVLFRVFQKIEGTSGSFPALQVRVWAKNADGEENNGIGQFFNNYATNPGHIRENFLQNQQDGTQYTVYDYTFAPSVQGSLSVSGFNYNASSMNVSFTANINMIEPEKYWGDLDQDGNPDNVIDAKTCRVVINSLKLANPPSSKAMVDNNFATGEFAATK